MVNFLAWLQNDPWRYFVLESRLFEEKTICFTVQTIKSPRPVPPKCFSYFTVMLPV